MKNKVICILILFILISCTFVSNSYANISYQGKSFPEFPTSEYKNSVIFYDSRDHSYNLIFYSDSKFGFFYSGSSSYLAVDRPFDWYRFSPESNSSVWIFRDDLDVSLNYTIGSWCVDGITEGRTFIYSSQDIFQFVPGTHEKGDIFFHKTPLLSFTNMQRWFGGIFWQVLMKALIILVPIGSTIFGAFCVIYLIKSKKWLPIKRRGF